MILSKTKLVQWTSNYYVLAVTLLHFIQQLHRKLMQLYIKFTLFVFLFSLFYLNSMMETGLNYL